MKKKYRFSIMCGCLVLTAALGLSACAKPSSEADLRAGLLSREEMSARFVQDSNPALPTAAQLGTPQLEPHASWMTRIEAEWRQRYTR